MKGIECARGSRKWVRKFRGRQGRHIDGEGVLELPQQLMTWPAMVDYNANEPGMPRYGNEGGKCRATQLVDDDRRRPIQTWIYALDGEAGLSGCAARRKQLFECRGENWMKDDENLRWYEERSQEDG